MTEPDDRELEQYLKGDSPLSRRYREASREAAPPELDEAILARARSELRRRPHGISRWLTPVALAASVMLGINLGWNVYKAAPPPGEVSQSKGVTESPAADATEPPPAAAPAEPSLPAAPAARERDARRADLEKKQESAALARRQASEQRSLAVEQERASDAAGAAVGAAAAPAPQARAPEAAGVAPELSWQDKSTQRRSEATETLPPGWHLYGDGQLYDASIDESTFHSPPSSLAVWRVGPGVKRCGRLQTEVPAQSYLGRTVRMTASVRTQGVQGPNLLLLLSFRRGGHMEDGHVRRFSQTEGIWRQQETSLAVPDNVESIVYGALLCGPGQLWLDDIELRVMSP